jgi:TPP-dependent trihydroxycyclohexane-1,2-dione (THcHDO) dehydratase
MKRDRSFFRTQSGASAGLPPIGDVAVLIREAKNPVIVAGGGAIYSDAEKELADFATRHAIPVIETQAGKSAPPQDHPMNLGAVGVDGSAAANALARKADLAASVCAFRILRPAGADFGKVC